MSAQHPAQCRLKEMGRRVIAHRCQPGITVNLSTDVLSYGQLPFLLNADANAHTGRALDGIGYLKDSPLGCYRSDIADLAAAFG